MNHRRESLMRGVFLTAALLTIAAVLLICFFLFANGLPPMKKIGVGAFLTGLRWFPSNVPAEFGILPMILGSVGVTLGAVATGVPAGILTAVFLAHYCPDPAYRLLKPAVELLAGIPSIVYGFFGMIVLVPWVRNTFGGNGNSLLTASLLLGLMILPTVVGVSEASLRAVPRPYYEGALALGATQERAIFFAVLPAAKSGLAAATVLGVGRAIGETMAVVMVAGNQAQVPNGLLGGVRTMTANIVIEMGYATGLHRGALIATGAVLFLFILAINLTVGVLKRRASV